MLSLFGATKTELESEIKRKRQRNLKIANTLMYVSFSIFLCLGIIGITNKLNSLFESGLCKQNTKRICIQVFNEDWQQLEKFYGAQFYHLKDKTLIITFPDGKSIEYKGFNYKIHDFNHSEISSLMEVDERCGNK